MGHRFPISEVAAIFFAHAFYKITHLLQVFAYTEMFSGGGQVPSGGQPSQFNEEQQSAVNRVRTQFKMFISLSQYFRQIGRLV